MTIVALYGEHNIDGTYEILLPRLHVHRLQSLLYSIQLSSFLIAVEVLTLAPCKKPPARATLPCLQKASWSLEAGAFSFAPPHALRMIVRSFDRYRGFLSAKDSRLTEKVQPVGIVF